jgi:hypothetical protein
MLVMTRGTPAVSSNGSLGGVGELGSHLLVFLATLSQQRSVFGWPARSPSAE